MKRARCRPLLPLYVSSVDSGNLAGHLLTLGSGLREQADEKIFTPQIFAGLRDTVEVLGFGRAKTPRWRSSTQNWSKRLPTLRAAFALLERAAGQATRIAASLANEEEELKGWAQTLQRELRRSIWRNCFSWRRGWHCQTCIPGPSDAAGCGSGNAESARSKQSRASRYQRQPCAREFTASSTVARTLHEARCRNSTRLPIQDRKASRELSRCLREAGDHARQRLLALETLAKQCDELAAMDFTFLFDPARDLFSIGFNVTERRCDASFYDLLASEARLCSYVAIALGQVPQDHWFSMGRLLVASGGEPILVSWSGSMFEYLMPLLVMPSYENTLLDHTCKAAVQQQIEYGKLRGVPWGISESGYNRTDVQLELPIPRLRRAGPGFETRIGRRSGDRSLRHRDGADGRAGRGV